MIEYGTNFLQNTRSKMDIVFDGNYPSIVTKNPHFLKGYKNILRRGGTIRCITTVTNDNLTACKDLQNIVTELKHLDDWSGGIAINESEYMATMGLEKENPKEILYSNIEEVITQGKYLFDNLWKNAVSANVKIKEIEEGTFFTYKTKILSKSDGSLNEEEIGNIISKAEELDMVATTGGLRSGYDLFTTMAKKISERKNVGSQKGIRILIEVTRDNLDIVKEFLRLGMEIRHIKKEPSIYFSVMQSNAIATIDRLDYREKVESLLYSDDPFYITRFKEIFERWWNDSSPAEAMIKTIQNNEEIHFIETIENPHQTLHTIKKLISSAENEILGLLPSFDALQRQIEIGMLDRIKVVSKEKKELTIKILVTDDIGPENEGDSSNSRNNLQIGKDRNLSFLFKKNIDHENIYDNDKPSQSTNISNKISNFKIDEIKNLEIRSIHSEKIRPNIGMLIVDKSKSVVIEAKESKSNNVIDHIGLSSYSNSPQISRSYATIFDVLWNHTDTYNFLKESYERLLIQEKMQKEFIDIVAHELRTPLQSILGLTDLVKNKTEEKENKEILEIVVDSGGRLHKFIENILTATKLEEGISNYSYEIFDLNEVIVDLVNNYQSKLQNLHNLSAPYAKEIDFNLQGIGSEFKINADKLQISMVISNIIDNAINFIPKEQKGLISITSKKQGNDVVVHIKDNGDGIDPDILPKLFTKFATKSFYGSGLGLYNSRKIIHMYNGGIWAKNNSTKEGGGATFSFKLPLA